ncbi:Enhancer of polycomb-like protein [Mycena venus]|uniref:Enhancer of polycomb-like protein n=1 Tax=Mycena venus TaxID=2733690 RepID=A0A8H6WUP1_9AGAR|nr:Enhancer of polycomb-like protein [Mycena venus]
MAPRVVLPPKKNRARCGIKYPLKIVKGDLPADSEYLDEDFDENASQMAVADVDAGETMEHHLQAALATKAVFIPTPGAISVVDNYAELYPPKKWTDPISYLKTTQTVEEACSNGLAEHDYTYYMDEIDKQWLDKNNQEARGEGTSAQGARQVRKGKDKSPEMGVPVSISEDEFELVMGLLEKMTDQKITDQKVFEGEGPDFESYEQFFLKPLPADMFASYLTPSWIPPSALLVRITRTIYPHWKQRRSLLKGHKIRPSLNFDESDFLNESYICFRRRDNKPVRKTRAGQVVNHAEKLTQLDQNLSRALDLANALLARENVKKAAAVQSHDVWRARQPMADLLRKFPSLITKADEERLLDKPKKPKTSRSSLPKVKVLPPSHPGASGTQAAAAGALGVLPSERCAAIQQEIMKNMQKESQEIKDNCQVDVVDDPYQPFLIPRAEKTWVDVPCVVVLCAFVMVVVVVAFWTGAAMLIPTSLSCAATADAPKRTRRRDEEDIRRLQGQWRFDADCSLFGPAEEENRELVDEYDSRYLVRRMSWATKAEAALVTDASIIVQRPDGRDMRVLPEQFLSNAIHVQGIYEKPTLSGHLAEEGIISTFSLGPARASAAAAAMRSPQKPTPTPVSSPSQYPSSHSRPQAPMRPPPSPALPRMQENISPKPGSAPSLPSAHSPVRPRAHITVPHNPNPIVPVSHGDAVKVGSGAQPSPVNGNGGLAQHHNAGQASSTHPLQTNGARTTAPAYVPLNPGTNMSLKLPPSRVPVRPSPLATHSVVASQLASNSSRTTSRPSESSS